MTPVLGPVILEGSQVVLEPMQRSHAGELLEAAQDSDWTWLPVDGRKKPEMDEWIEQALRAQGLGTAYPFTVFRKHDRKVLGSTRYMDVRAVQKGVEVGWTWYTSNVWGTLTNPECKFLMLRHAFEEWKAIRVQLKTDDLNLHSQNAILKLGAKFEGRLRNHRIRQDDSSGDSMMYSITDSEWRESVGPALKQRVERLLKAGS